MPDIVASWLQVERNQRCHRQIRNAAQLIDGRDEVLLLLWRLVVLIKLPHSTLEVAMRILDSAAAQTASRGKKRSRTAQAANDDWTVTGVACLRLACKLETSLLKGCMRLEAFQTAFRKAGHGLLDAGGYLTAEANVLAVLQWRLPLVSTDMLLAFLCSQPGLRDPRVQACSHYLAALSLSDAVLMHAPMSSLAAAATLLAMHLMFATLTVAQMFVVGTWLCESDAAGFILGLQPHVDALHALHVQAVAATDGSYLRRMRDEHLSSERSELTNLRDEVPARLHLASYLSEVASTLAPATGARNGEKGRRLRSCRSKG